MIHPRTPPRPSARVCCGPMFAAVAFALLLVGFTGCTRPLVDGDAELQISSRDAVDRPGQTVAGAFTRAYYRFEDRNTVTVLLIQGPDEAPRRVAALEMFWKARAGLTPIDRTATNALVRFFEFRDTQDEPNTVGIYAGAGFMRLHDDPLLGTVDGNLWDADLRLTDRSEIYTDRLGRAVLAGSFTAQRNDARVTKILRELNQMIEQRLGYPRLVEMSSIAIPMRVDAASPLGVPRTLHALPHHRLSVLDTRPLPGLLTFAPHLD